MKFIVALALFLPLCATLDVTARRYVLAENASKFYTELDNRHENVTLSIDPHATALVLIDVWVYTSNDRTPSSLHGPIPKEMGKLKALKCMYFSHNNLNGSIPKELEGLTELQVFLMRCNQLSGELIDFSKLTKLRNVWFDTNAGLTGALDGLGQLRGLTFLQASHNPGIGGPVPASLCGVDCDAAATGVTCADELPQGCCGISSCGKAPAAPPPPPSTMGECFPQ